MASYTATEQRVLCMSGSLGTGTKFDGGKPRMSLLDPFVLREVAKVLTFGEKKYAANNWRGGFELSRLTDAALRHITSWIEGEDTDPESGLSHLAHGICCLMFCLWLYTFKPHLDDRYKNEKTESQEGPEQGEASDTVPNPTQGDADRNEVDSYPSYFPRKEVRTYSDFDSGRLIATDSMWGYRIE